MAFDPFTLTGIVGTALMVAAYFATQQGRLTAKDWRYPLANLVGAILMLVSLVSAWNLPVAIIESFWAVISVYGQRPTEAAPKCLAYPGRAETGGALAKVPPGRASSRVASVGR